TEAGVIPDFNCPAGCNLDRRLDDVARPVAPARRDIAREDEIGESGESDIVGAADTRFQHTAAPDRDTCRSGGIVHQASFAKSTHPAQLDINDAARTQPDRLLGVVRGADALVQAE